MRLHRLPSLSTNYPGFVVTPSLGYTLDMHLFFGYLRGFMESSRPLFSYLSPCIYVNVPYLSVYSLVGNVLHLATLIVSGFFGFSRLTQL
jgi:hypothetical protein